MNVDLLKTLLPEAAYDFFLCGPATTLKEDRAAKATRSTTDEGWRVSFARSGISASWDVSSPRSNVVLDL